MYLAHNNIVNHRMIGKQSKVMTSGIIRSNHSMDKLIFRVISTKKKAITKMFSQLEHLLMHLEEVVEDAVGVSEVVEEVLEVEDNLEVEDKKVDSEEEENVGEDSEVEEEEEGVEVDKAIILMIKINNKKKKKRFQAKMPF